ncbi:hypothetical protein NKH57_33210 [Mesorhizobium sp. M1050]
MEEPFEVCGHMVSIGTSIGISASKYGRRRSFYASEADWRSWVRLKSDRITTLSQISCPGPMPPPTNEKPPSAVAAQPIGEVSIEPEKAESLSFPGAF